VTGAEGESAVKVIRTDSPGVIEVGALLIARPTTDEARSKKLTIAFENMMNMMRLSCLLSAVENTNGLCITENRCLEKEDKISFKKAGDQFIEQG